MGWQILSNMTIAAIFAWPDTREIYDRVYSERELRFPWKNKYIDAWE